MFASIKADPLVPDNEAKQLVHLSTHEACTLLRVGSAMISSKESIKIDFLLEVLTFDLKAIYDIDYW